MSSVVNLLPTIQPKSDQLNADDLIGGPKTIKVTTVNLCGEADQPIAVHFEGDQNKPYKPCKSMRRVLVHVWGADGNAYVGRSLTLYRDEKVQFGNQPVGGIRISHMSDIDSDITMALTATRAQRRAFTVRPLRERARPPEGTQRGSSTPSLADRADRLLATLKAYETQEKRDKAWELSAGLRAALDKADPDRLAEIEALYKGHAEEPDTDDFQDDDEIPF